MLDLLNQRSLGRNVGNVLFERLVEERLAEHNLG
jgi:hypothetical protein